MMIDPGKIFDIHSEKEFEELALEIFHFQAEIIPVYKEFIYYLGKNPANVTELSEIPFLPVEFFKYHEIITPGKKPQIIFTSSGTTGSIPSRHPVADLHLYEKSFFSGFKLFYSDPENYCFLALLPSFDERKDSSLIFMSDKLIKSSRDPDSGFYLSEKKKLIKVLEEKNAAGIPTILLGISFTIAELAESFKTPLSGIIFMETGGMKGHRKEIVREELHNLICRSFAINSVHSEYGMTELLSQAYSKGNGIFNSPPWMRISIRDIHDPDQTLKPSQTGRINIIDLANIHSCSFLSTSDLGRIHPDGCFEIMGRADDSDLRGCNLMMT